MKVTITNITQVKLSKQKDQSTFKKSEYIQLFNTNILTFPVKIVFNNNIIEKKLEVIVVAVVNAAAPLPITLPNKLPLKNPNKGKIIIVNNIKSITNGVNLKRFLLSLKVFYFLYF